MWHGTAPARLTVATGKASIVATRRRRACVGRQGSAPRPIRGFRYPVPVGLTAVAAMPEGGRRWKILCVHIFDIFQIFHRIFQHLPTSSTAAKSAMLCVHIFDDVEHLQARVVFVENADARSRCRPMTVRRVEVATTAHRSRRTRYP
jgi:hypothetical protein